MKAHTRFTGLRRITLAVLLSVVPAASFAAGTWTVAAGMVTAVYSHEGYHYVQTTIPDATCGAAGRFWWLAADSDAKDMFALALAAFLAGKQVRVVQDGAAPNCNNGGNLATHMVISD
jgi:hypothetical protein